MINLLPWRRLAATIALAMLAGASSTAAQIMSGLEFGLGSGALHVSAEGGESTSLGVGITMAWSLAEDLTLGLDGSAGQFNKAGSDPESAWVSTGGGFGRIYFVPREQNIRPYVVLSMGQGYYEYDLDGQTVSISGPYKAFGIGADRSWKRTVGFFGEIRYTSVDLQKKQYLDTTRFFYDFDAHAFSVNVGVRIRIHRSTASPGPR
jgi:hypothetical protein